ncbi:hypothetical protein NP493_558g01017 [Ridgeia piscesae]|uniref:5'-3' exoribonuclease n=1 Tax=Ridgeia piscesae TaxID=27915 RepID=A0AAD9KVD3_RIDPI|nr:hypothetical protein NP493_558g01017 [Ridgeia piscesae]
MGVPAFFRWLSRKYPSIVVHCIEEKVKSANGVKAPIDTSQTNPNDVEFDNLYLDMNGIIHPCCHPENKPAPKNEDEMMADIFEYIDRIFAIVRPRKVLYMAIDGVAPRAKMNQQRSRRFRASQEAEEKKRDIARIKEELRSKGAIVPPDKPASEHFDSNCITPGTPFMFRLADCLRYYIHVRLNNDPGWKNIKVILSDANVPGEGEHKIMDYIRRQRAQPGHDPNTHHCLCGADADLIMLGLATHEPNFTIIREEFKPNQPRPCELCNQIGHELKECTGAPREKEGENDELTKLTGAETEFIFIRLNVLHEYLEKELQMTNLPFKQDIERAIDDWVFMCFFVGNDFLPHLPSLEIREGAIDRLITIYKKTVYKTGGYLTDSGIVNLDRVQLVLSELGEAEDEIFKRRRDTDLHFKRKNKERRRREKMMKTGQRPSFLLGGQYAPRAPGDQSTVTQPRVQAYQKRMQVIAQTSSQNSTNEEAAAALRSMLKDGGEGGSTSNTPPQKRKLEEDNSSEEEPDDEVKLWEDGWKQRYYESKFNVGPDEIAFRHTVGNEYVIGLCWVLLYYYQGCPSWKWYFPYHYAPFASDFCNIGDITDMFEKNTEPFKPLEQLMGVFPAGSKQFIPPTWQELMTSCESSIIDFYPTNFKIDLNGKKYAWQGVALLPFVDEKRLKEALSVVYPDLTEDEKTRNTRGADRLFVGKNHPSHDFFEALYEEGGSTEAVELDTSKTEGMGGTVWRDDHVVLTNQTLPSPVPQLEDLHNNQAIAIQYSDPKFAPDFIFSAKRLKNAIMPAPTLKPEDFNRRQPNQGYRPQLGFSRNSHYRMPNTRDSGTANRLVRGQLGGNVPPPQNYYQPRPPFGGSILGSYPQPGAYGAQQQGGYQAHRQGGGGYQQGSYGGYAG